VSRATGIRAPLIRELGPGDETALEAFLARHADSSMFLRASLRRGGLGSGDTPDHGRYLASFAGLGAGPGADVTGVIAIYGNGNVVVQAPSDAATLARALAAQRLHEAIGFVGPAAQVAAIKPALAPRNRPLLKDSLEILFALDLERLVIPPLLARGDATARRARAADFDLLVRWRCDYIAETLGARGGPDLMVRARADMVERLDVTWLLEAGGEPLASQSFNASLPDIVQVGGVWTPPGLRGRGYARAVVGGALHDVRATGVRRGVLFTGSDNAPAQRAYRAIGFTPIGDYALVQYGEPRPPSLPTPQ
jgi:RimJ/RimL family protein N-acetyltransferase